MSSNLKVGALDRTLGPRQVQTANSSLDGAGGGGNIKLSLTDSNESSAVDLMMPVRSRKFPTGLIML